MGKSSIGEMYPVVWEMDFMHSVMKNLLVYSVRIHTLCAGIVLETRNRSLLVGMAKCTASTPVI